MFPANAFAGRLPRDLAVTCGQYDPIIRQTREAMVLTPPGRRDTELACREYGDELLKPGELTGIRRRLREVAPGHGLTTVIACAFDHRTRMLPFIFTDRRMAPAGVRAVGSAAHPPNSDAKRRGRTIPAGVYPLHGNWMVAGASLLSGALASMM